MDIQFRISFSHPLLDVHQISILCQWTYGLKTDLKWTSIRRPVLSGTIRARNYQIRWKINVWAGIMGTKILGAVILPLNGASYLKFLTENLPDFLEKISLLDRNRIIFQQDSAGPHNARIVTNYLNQEFPGRWMGRYGSIRWPARSPDLNPLDFFLWGYCKEVKLQTAS